MAQLQVRRLGYALGANVTGIDLSRPIDDETVGAIRQVSLEHLLVRFPDQNLNADQLVAFASRFGVLDNNEIAPSRDPNNPHILFNSNKPSNGKPWHGYKQGQSWHSDRSFTERPDLLTFLLAKEIPAVGGDTLFTNMYMAYETLSPAMRGIVDRLSAVHDAAKIKNREQREAGRSADFLQLRPPVVHPVTKLHPESNRKALFVGDRVSKFVGMTDEESEPLLNFLVNHAVTYEFTYRHRWSVNDLLLWDNRCLMHVALSDYDLHNDPRHMLRCTIPGPKTGEVYAAGDDFAQSAKHAAAASS
jgi:taurine dioxygenase